MKTSFVVRLRILLVCMVIVTGAGCASSEIVDERDPWEGFNRGVYAFNQGIDNVLFEPLGKLYDFITPDVVDNGVTNFFDNLTQLSVVANDILQFKFDQAVSDTVRLFINSTFGLLGFFDISSSAGLHSSKEDFGQTLAHWGVGSGPYLVVPFFGPTTVRDATGFVVDRGVFNPIFYLDDDLTRAGLLSLNYVDFKADSLSVKSLLGEAALDEYEFTKNLYFEKRKNQINDQ